MENPESDLFRPYDQEWFDGWLSQDFSWAGLSAHPAWQRDTNSNLQNYLRSFDRDASNPDLLANDILVDCHDKGLFHVLFVPEEWAASGICKGFDSDRLLERQRAYWNRLQSERIRDHFNGTIRGAMLADQAAPSLIQATRASFEWTRFGHELSGLIMAGDRSFYACYFRNVVNVSDPVTNTKSSLHFTSCHFNEKIEFVESRGLLLVDFNSCKILDRIDFHDSSIEQLRVDECVVTRISAGDSEFGGNFTIANCTLDWIECINCSFNGHTLLLSTVFEHSLGFLGCDFLGRVTFAEIEWPHAAYMAATASGSKFTGIVEFAGGNPPPIQLFRDAEFASRVAFRGHNDLATRGAFERELAATESSGLPHFDQSKHAEDIESGCRTLRKLSEAFGDVHGEHLWHRAELIARRTRGQSTISEKAASVLYGLTADYGISIGRPFLTLLTSVFLFAVIYAWVGGTAWLGYSIEWKSLEEGLGYSLNRTIPIGVFSDEGNVWRRQLLGSGGQPSDIAIRALATGQSIISAILIYLGVMSVRRKFRIS